MLQKAQWPLRSIISIQETAKTLTDEQSLRRMATGDRSAFTVFYDRYSGRVFGFLLHFVRSRALAEDALQDTFWHPANPATYVDIEIVP